MCGISRPDSLLTSRASGVTTDFDPRCLRTHRCVSVQHRQGLPGPHEAVGFQRATCQPRCVGVSPFARLDGQPTGECALPLVRLLIRVRCGCQDPGRVFPGKKMAGHMGVDRVTMQNLLVSRCFDFDRFLIGPATGSPWCVVAGVVGQVYKIDTKHNLLYVKGAIAGYSSTRADLRTRPCCR